MQKHAAKNASISFFCTFYIVARRIHKKECGSKPRDTLLWKCGRPTTRSLAVQRAARRHRRNLVLAEVFTLNFETIKTETLKK